MPTTYSGAEIVRMSLFFTLDGQGGQIDRNVSALNPAFDAAFSSTALLGQINAVGVITAAQACMSTAASYLGCKLYSKPVSAPPKIDQSLVGAGACTGGAGFLPTQNSGLISYQSSIGGSRGRGRDYVPFPYTNATTAAGRCSASYLTALAALAAAIVGGWNVPNTGGGGGVLSIYPCTIYTTGTTPVPYQMTSWSVALGFATQRRRGYFGKLNRSPFA